MRVGARERRGYNRGARSADRRGRPPHGDRGAGARSDLSTMSAAPKAASGSTQFMLRSALTLGSLFTGSSIAHHLWKPDMVRRRALFLFGVRHASRPIFVSLIFRYASYFCARRRYPT